jgi:hypothetical protein
MVAAGAGNVTHGDQPPFCEAPHGRGWANETTWLAAAFTIFAAEERKLQRRK